MSAAIQMSGASENVKLGATSQCVTLLSAARSAAAGPLAGSHPRRRLHAVDLGQVRICHRTHPMPIKRSLPLSTAAGVQAIMRPREQKNG